MIVWVEFLGLAAVILVAGVNLSKYGDIIAEKTGMGRTWIGAILMLMASVTSLPELVTGISSVAVFNLLLIALLDALSRKVPAVTRAAPGHALVAAFEALLLGMASFATPPGARSAARGRWLLRE